MCVDRLTSRQNDASHFAICTILCCRKGTDSYDSVELPFIYSYDCWQFYELWLITVKRS